MPKSLSCALPEQFAPPTTEPIPRLSQRFMSNGRVISGPRKASVSKTNIFLSAGHHRAKHIFHNGPVSPPSIFAIYLFTEADDIFRRLHGMSDCENQIKISCRPFGTIHLPIRETAQLFGVLLEVLTLLRRIRQRVYDWRRTVRIRFRRVRKTFDQPIQDNPCHQCVAAIGGCKHRIRLPPEEKPTLDRRTENGSENCKHGTDRRPSIPPNYTAADSGLHARAYSIPQLLQLTHSQIPLWTGRHFATAHHRDETDHG